MEKSAVGSLDSQKEEILAACPEVDKAMYSEILTLYFQNYDPRVTVVEFRSEVGTDGEQK